MLNDEHWWDLPLSQTGFGVDTFVVQAAKAGKTSALREKRTAERRTETFLKGLFFPGIPELRVPCKQQQRTF